MIKGFERGKYNSLPSRKCSKLIFRKVDFVHICFFRFQESIIWNLCQILRANYESMTSLHFIPNRIKIKIASTDRHRLIFRMTYLSGNLAVLSKCTFFSASSSGDRSFSAFRILCVPHCMMSRRNDRI